MPRLKSYNHDNACQYYLTEPKGKERKREEGLEKRNQVGTNIKISKEVNQSFFPNIIRYSTCFNNSVGS